MALDLPTLEPSQPPILTRLAIFADPWPGSVTVWRSVDRASYQAIALAAASATIGETLDGLPPATSGHWDHGHVIRVRLYGGALTSLSDARVLNGANAAAVRNADGVWEVLQFASAVLVDDRTYL
ncbi:MAG TPA: hypothetical protein VGE73_01835, partial [Pseudolabrys sp.]